MKKSTTPDTTLNDTDIAQLFDAQPVQTPNDMRTTILERAEQALSDASSDNSSEINHRQLNDKKVSTRRRTLPVWLPNAFAVAATVVIAIIIVPVLMTEPELTSDRTAGENADTKNTNLALAQKSESETLASTQPTAPSSSTGELLSRSSDSAFAAQNSSPEHISQADVQLETSNHSLDEQPTQRLSATSPITTQEDELITSTNQHRKLGSGGSAGDPLASEIQNNDNETLSMRPLDSQKSSEKQSDSIQAYRSTAIKWMNEIKIMIVDGDADKARQEYRLFAQKHPDQAKNFRPDFNRRAMGTEIPSNEPDQ